MRVSELLKRELGMLITRDLLFKAPLVSVRAIDITPDLKRAHVFISALGTGAQKKEALQVLTKNRSLLQKELSKRVILKYTPHLIFELDESIERGIHVIDLLDKLDQETVNEEPAS
jgi:ribosome-binding factor A